MSTQAEMILELNMTLIDMRRALTNANRIIAERDSMQETVTTLEKIIDDGAVVTPEVSTLVKTLSTEMKALADLMEAPPIRVDDTPKAPE